MGKGLAGQVPASWFCLEVSSLVGNPSKAVSGDRDISHPETWEREIWETWHVRLHEVRVLVFKDAG